MSMALARERLRSLTIAVGPQEPDLGPDDLRDRQALEPEVRG